MPIIENAKIAKSNDHYSITVPVDWVRDGVVKLNEKYQVVITKVMQNTEVGMK